MLGRDVCHTLSQTSHAFAALSRHELDITDADAMLSKMAWQKPDVVIHCAAYTNVNGAEANPGEALQVNANGARNVAHACRETGATMLYVSTDYVFEGTKGAPYEETDAINPLGVYGKSKAEGEAQVRQILP